ncbi:hydrogenase maturation nickel metallochaperone HypA [Coprothermobacter platensis]|uniref:hydrogenase maturation nickel metallochaperone HypA/HybF n=1 Tax=Coprothermobacter platensis TaxID=108819 RepID=UPI000364C1E2|nr:hydrogenase maturation nickel metallochaperone HypA [Coprothermobacter platensis]
MHEYSVAKYAVEEILELLGNKSPELVTAVGLKIGKMSGIVPDSLLYYLGILAPESGLKNVTFHTSLQPVLFKCNNCETLFEPSRELFWCPRCGSSDVTFVSGNELEIDYIEMEKEVKKHEV